MKRYLLVSLLGIIMIPNVCSAAHDFAYYQRKIRKFLEYYGHQAPESIEVKEIENHIDMPGWVIKAYRLKQTIYINCQAFQHEAHGVNLFTCAHETAHLVFHDTTAKGYDIEQDADIKAAQMLCNNGYAWAVQEKIAALEYLIEQGKGDIEADEKHPRPTVKSQHEYLSQILDKYLAEHPFQARILKMNAALDMALLAGSHLVVGVSGILVGISMNNRLRSIFGLPPV